MAEASRDEAVRAKTGKSEEAEDLGPGEAGERAAWKGGGIKGGGI